MAPKHYIYTCAGIYIPTYIDISQIGSRTDVDIHIQNNRDVNGTKTLHTDTYRVTYIRFFFHAYFYAQIGSHADANIHI